MEIRARYATIGFFTLTVIVLAFGFVYWLKRLDETGTRTTVYYEFTGTVGGLAPGAAVQFAGIKVGNVTGLAFDPNDPNVVLVTAAVREDTPVKADSTAEIGSNLLTGVAYIDMYGGTPGAPSLFEQTPPKIIGSRSALTDVVSEAGSAVSRVEQIAERVDTFIAANEQAMTSTIENVETFTAALAGNADGLGEFLANVSKMSQTVEGLSGRLDGLVAQADRIVGAIEPDKVRSAIDKVDRFMGQAADASDQIGDILAQVTRAVDQVSRFTDGLNETLVEVQSVVTGVDRTKLSTAVNNIASFAEQLNEAAPEIDAMVVDAKETIANANSFTASLNAHQDDFDEIVADAKSLADRLNATSVRLDSVLGKADNLLGGEVGEGSRNFFQEASAAARAIRTAAENLTLRADEIATGVTQFSGRGLADVTSLVNELRASIARIDRAVADIASDPAGLVFGGSSNVREYNRR